MPYILKRPDWWLPERVATSESAYLNRRTFLKQMGLAGLMAGGLKSGAAQAQFEPTVTEPLPGFERNSAFANVGRPLTHEYVGTTFNNFWEFSFNKNVASVTTDFKIDPYTFTIDGLVEKPITLGLEDIERLGYEERVYRFRCVEAWSMTIPWLGLPLRKLIELAKPTSKAKYVAFKSFYDPEQAPNQLHPKYTWPYHEGLRLDEAMNELTFVATGAWGKRLLPQSGTPLRIVIPWKYGYKGPKSVVQMTFVKDQPSTFWETAVPAEYPFYSNVDPLVPHPRWSQAEEKLIVDKANEADVTVIPTKRFNGYGEQVAALYSDMPRRLM